MAATVLVTPDDGFAAAAATRIADAMHAAIAARGECSVALCGGSTPVPVFRDLVGRTVAWADVAVYFGDERAVPPDHPESNYRQAREALLDHVPVPPQRVYRMEAERTDRDQAAREYERVLPRQLDVLLLGVGLDGHTASLFPGAPAAQETERRVVAAAPPELPLQPQLDRMTITPPVIALARQVIVMVTGAGKADLLARILEGPYQPIVLPAQYARSGTWMLDHAAARHLHPQDT